MGDLRPSDGTISKWRQEAVYSGRHEQISTDTQQLLDVDVARELRDVQVGDYMTLVHLREMADIVGVSRAGNKGELITRLQAVIQSINATGTVVTSVGKGRIPWVLTKEQTILVNNRFKRLVIPPHVDAFLTSGNGLFDDKSSCWR